MENESMSKKYYWKIFGKTNISKTDKKYIDLCDEMPSYMQKRMQKIYATDFENDVALEYSQAFSGKKAILLNKEKQFSNEICIPVNSRQKGYYRAAIRVFANKMEWNVWNQTQWIISLSENNIETRSNYYRVYRIINPNSWQNICIDIKTSDQKSSNILKIKFWNANSEKQILFDDLVLYFAPY